MKKITQDIAEGTLRSAYLLYGTEAYLRKQYRDKLVKAFLPDGDTMNLSRYEGDNPPVGEIIDLAETMPFFADRRVILIENSGLFHEAETDLAEYLKEIPETTAFIFVESKVDKRTKMYKNLQKCGYAASLDLPEEKDLVIWVAGRIGKEKKKVSENVIKGFIAKCGSDMNTMEMELDKLLAYTLHQEVITQQDVDEICTQQLTDRIFEMIDDYSNSRYDHALRLYYDLLQLHEAPMKILVLLGRQFRNLYSIREMSAAGLPREEIAKALGMHPYAVKKNMSCAARIGKEQLQRSMELCAQLEEDVKTGRIRDQLSVEVLLTKRG